MAAANALIGDQRGTRRTQRSTSSITKNYAPWAAYDNRNMREFVSARTGGYLFQPAHGQREPEHLLPQVGEGSRHAEQSSEWAPGIKPAPTCLPRRAPKCNRRVMTTRDALPDQTTSLGGACCSSRSPSSPTSSSSSSRPTRPSSSRARAARRRRSRRPAHYLGLDGRSTRSTEVRLSGWSYHHDPRPLVLQPRERQPHHRRRRAGHRLARHRRRDLLAADRDPDRHPLRSAAAIAVRSRGDDLRPDRDLGAPGLDRADLRVLLRLQAGA